jgi:hypothetical protein
MSILSPVVFESENLSLAWGRALVQAFDAPKSLLAPMLLSVAGFRGPLPPEDMDVRKAADEALERQEENSVAVSGLMIFPYDMWCRRGKPHCKPFSDLCVTRYLPRLQRLDKRNVHGTYFGRMMEFRGQKRGQPETINQLEFIINLLKRRDRRWPRQSALQIACFDPIKDHTGQSVRGFPCLQQVSVVHDGDSRFALNAYYPTQYIFDRGYGNYLGLCHLGAFIAHETGLEFVRLNCFVARPELGSPSKKSLEQLVQFVRRKLP